MLSMGVLLLLSAVIMSYSDSDIDENIASESRCNLREPREEKR
jgi:hypothetical protein